MFIFFWIFIFIIHLYSLNKIYLTWPTIKSYFYIKIAINITDRYCFLKDARVWIPDPERVWKAAKLLDDYKPNVPHLRVLTEEDELVIKLLKNHSYISLSLIIISISSIGDRVRHKLESSAESEATASP